MNRREQAEAVSSFANLVVAAGLPLDAQDPTGQHAHSAFEELKSYFPALSMEVLSTGPEVQSGTVEGLSESIRRGSILRQRESRAATLLPASLRMPTRHAHVLNTSAVLDCQTGGVIVTHP